MKKRQKLVICTLVVVTMLSAMIGGPAGVLAFANTTSTSELNRLLVKGSIGNDVKLLQTLLNNEGANLEVDGSFGPLTLKAVKEYQSKNGLKVDGFVGPLTRASLMGKAAQIPTVTEPTKPTTPTAPTAPTTKPVETTTTLAPGKTALKIGRADYAAHGTKSFANVTVALVGDKIVATSIEEYQFMAKASNTGVPNSDKDFGKNYADPEMVLASKLVNADAYSANMAAKAGSTVHLRDNFKAIENFVKGKTVAELKAVTAKTPQEVVDAVSGATLVDTYGYINAVVKAAETIRATFPVDVTSINNLTMGRADFAAHGTKSFASTVTVLDGDKIVAASIEEYQFMAKASNTGVPNSDKDFGKNYADPNMVLASKLDNADTYSANMATKAGSTVHLLKNFNAIETFTTGKTVAELEKTLSNNTAEQMVDAVTSATLVDTYGYVKAIVEAAKKAPVSEKTALKIGRADYAAHGTKSFANVTVALAGDKIVATSIEEYQFMAKASNTGVPNSDKDFGKNYADPEMVLASKLVNADAYSANMAAKAGSTVHLRDNFKAIENFVKGKTVAELKAVTAKTPQEVVDAVSGATLVDTYGYINAVVKAAETIRATFPVDTASINNLKIGRADFAAHGTKSFASAVAILDGDKIVAASIEEYQFMAKASNTGVPNSDKDFGKNYADPNMVLASKLDNANTYSANMAAKAGSTVHLLTNFNAIEAFTTGKTVAELESLTATKTAEEMVDAVTSATLVDTTGYVKSIAAAAKLAK
ncbi:peptidoglycan-binding domain-containing protein [Alkaliphilus oremlandii]|uniref:Peptidoglycan-binding domain 1 protein n=1 Tax=Alkaliphilus oremlandii (strain OhILAs) TaxID=350688 RepID=A8MKP2_ALKOO|nr:peptidoglycan-binding domain-containing protein [Alkaliphilus oremlandii]ABW20374.1 Peptidoglycan-binding domain 1 protein [Alkaliphilus oremlandii OhILAs]